MKRNSNAKLLCWTKHHESIPFVPTRVCVHVQEMTHSSTPHFFQLLNDFPLMVFFKNDVIDCSACVVGLPSSKTPTAIIYNWIIVTKSVTCST